MQTTLTLSSNPSNLRLPGSDHSLRLRAFRLLGERYAQREPGFVPEFTLFGVIVFIVGWSLVALGHAMALIR